MENKILIPNSTSQQIIMVGVKRDTPGGMASVINSYFQYIEDLQYITTWKLASLPVKCWYALKSILHFTLLLIFNHRIKVVHIQGAANASFSRKAMFIYLAKWFRKKVILHMHACDFVEYYDKSNKKEWILRTINHCDTLIVLSQSWKEYFASLGIPQDKIHILNNIVTPPINNSTPRSDNKLHLLFLGEIGKRKGIYDILNALAQEREYFSDKLLLRIGGNLEEEKLRATIQSLQLEEFVKFEGWVSGDKKRECLEWADIYILPSFNEGLPIGILEAMSYKMPIISSPVGGIPEVVHDHENGLIVEPGNTLQIKNAIKFFIENPQLIQQYGKSSYNLVTPYFPESVMNSLNNIYQGLLK